MDDMLRRHDRGSSQQAMFSALSADLPRNAHKIGMGNSQSHGPPTGPVRQGMPRGPPVRWPRAEPPIQVLPQVPPVPVALRNTPNGAILQQGGTISSRPQNLGPRPLRRPRSHSAHRPPQTESPDLARCGSEPDLRASPHNLQRNREVNRHQMSRGRKKYRAPPAPHPGSGVESSSPDLNGWDQTPRKARLFKTRAETNRRPYSEEDHHRRIAQTMSLPRAEESRPWRASGGDDQRQWRRETSGKGMGEIVSLPRVESKERTGRRSVVEDHSIMQRSRSQDALSNGNSLSTPEFQAELLEAAQKLRPRSALLPRPAYEKNVNTPEPPIEPTPKTTSEPSKENAQPQKTFYFGMEESNKTVATKAVNSNVNKTNREHRLTAVEKSKNLMNLKHRQEEKKHHRQQDDDLVLEKFAASFQKARAQQSASGTSSLTSEPDPDEVDGGIALQLRPTLPKKQLEIPRFSPTAAWRLLSTVDAVSSPSPDSERAVSEERIPVPDSFGPAAVHLSLDKSGDSGISGDASPGGGHESSSELVDTPPKAIHVLYPHQQKSLLLAWTPEQDLEESSSEEEPPLQSKLDAAPGAKLTTRGHLFSTLPRERIEEPQTDNLTGSRFNSLRHPAQGADSNWLLSRSVPGSLNSGHAPVIRTCSSPSSPEQGEELPLMAKYPSFTYLAQGGHVVYLPEYKSKSSPDYSTTPNNHHLLSRSCENISAEYHEEMNPWSISNNDNNMNDISNSLSSDNNNNNSRPSSRSLTEQRPHKKKKFTFQSTVRLLENRKLAEKLSREAEFKESQRLSEVEAMRRVEEEFQKKRAREKASIRHQLRLFSLEEKEYTSLPSMDWGRADPDGAPSSLPPARHGGATHVLSEFREPTREYRDYRQPSSRRAESPEITMDAPQRKHIVQHPRIVADMPKNLPVYVSALTSSSAVTPSPRPRDNYRKEFAHGSVARTNSDSDSQPRTRPGSRQNAHWTRSKPEVDRLSRSRSASPSTPTSGSTSPNQQTQIMSRSPSASPLIQSWSERRSHSPSPCLRSRQSSASPSSVRSRSTSSEERRQRSMSRSRSASRDEIQTSSFVMLAAHSEKNINVSSQPPKHSLLLSAVQPFSKAGKTYRPITFNPATVAQIVN